MHIQLFYKPFLIMILLTFLISCENVNNKEEVKVNTKSVEKNINLKEKLEKINRKLEKAVLEGDYDSILPYYTEDVIISPAFQPSVKGKEDIREIYKKNKKLGLKYHSFSGTLEDVWECDKFVYERGKFGMSVSYKDHPKPVAYYGTYFTIWQKESGDSLLIKYVIWNLDFNPCEK